MVRGARSASVPKSRLFSWHCFTRNERSHMARSLVIVESPAKAKTINKYLGRNYVVKASYGHVMDLPRKNIGILLPPDAESKTKKKKKKKAKADAKPAPKPVVVTEKNIFEPTYEVIPNKIKVINDLRKAASTAEAVYLAGDPDREGEAICAHLEEILSNPRQYSNLVEPKEDGEEEPKNGDKSAAKKETKVTTPTKETKAASKSSNGA